MAEEEGVEGKRKERVAADVGVAVAAADAAVAAAAEGEERW